MKTKQIIGIFDEETNVVKALKAFKDQKVEVRDIYGPCADHDILKYHTRPTRIPHLTFIYGIMAIVLTFAFLYYTSVISYPILYGGKPLFSFPPMVVLMYLMTILTAGMLTAVTMLVRTQLFPGKQAKMPAPRLLDDQFAMLIENAGDVEKVKRVLKDSGATEINENDVE
jgi:hypothetical protein